MKQIFTKIYPKYKFIKFIINNCIKDKNFWIFDINIFKKLSFTNDIGFFLEDLKEYYRPSKRYYVEKGSTYKGFVTIIRHLCKFHNITYNNITRYIHNSYTIDYQILLTEEEIQEYQKFAL